VQWAIAKYHKKNGLAMPADWFKWSFTLPAKFSIDNGRDGQSRREDYKFGHKNLRDILGEQGIDYEQHRRTRVNEVRDLLKSAAKLAEETETPFGLVLSLLQQQTATGSVGGGVFGTPVADPNNPEPEPEPKQIPTD